MSSVSRTVAALIVGVLALATSLIAIPASAVPTPSAGPVSGGTVVTIEGIHFVKVAPGRYGALGLTNEGTVYAWGYNYYGQLGDGTTTDSLLPVPVKGVGGLGVLSGVTDIAMGSYSSYAIVDGNLFAWGDNAWGQLGDGSTSHRSTPVQVQGVGGSGSLSGISSISAGEFFAVASGNGEAYAWGINNLGQLGSGTSGGYRTTPGKVVGLGGTGYLTGILSVHSGEYQTYAITSNGLFSWGYNATGQLGDNTTTDSASPVRVLGVGGSGTLDGVTAVASGTNHAIAISDAGLVAWGNNAWGQLGDNTFTNSSTPVRVLGEGGAGYLGNVTSISASSITSFARTDSYSYSWGSNTEGELGAGIAYSTLYQQTPIKIVGINGSGLISGVSKIFASNKSVSAIINGQIVAWGYNNYGGLGNGLNTRTNVPKLGPNFQKNSVTFGGQSGTNLGVTGTTWSVTTPESSAGQATIVATANVLGGITVASPATVTWNAGTFTYQAALANTGVPNNTPLFIGSGIALLLGVGLLIGLRRQNRK
jgi:LPXTG-motif cell wall-anchored protein